MVVTDILSAIPGGMWLVTWAFLHVLAIAIILIDPPLTRWHVVALMPWWGVGGAAYAIFSEFDVDGYLEWIELAVALPAVYMTFPALGVVVLGMANFSRNTIGRPRHVERAIGVSGAVILSVLFVALLWLKSGTELTFAPIWMLFVVSVVSFLIASLVYILMQRQLPGVTNTFGYVALAFVFVHVFQAVSVILGANVLNFDVLALFEGDIIAGVTISFAQSLGISELIGTGWVYLLIKIGLSLLPLIFLKDSIHEKPTLNNLALILISALEASWGIYKIALMGLLL